MTITLICPNLRCTAVLQVPESARGKKVRCGHCGCTLVVPQKKSVEKVAAAQEEKAAGA